MAFRSHTCSGWWSHSCQTVGFRFSVSIICDTMEQSSGDTSKSHYSFGDNRLAALRLEHLAAAFAPSSRRFLQGTKPGRVELALDLGSGIGATTALVRDVTNAPRVVGYERSGNLLAIARRQYPELTFRDIDVLSPAYPDREADLIYCRFLLTHIRRPADVLTTSGQHLRSGGRLLLEETAALFLTSASALTVLRSCRTTAGAPRAGDIDRKEA